MTIEAKMQVSLSQSSKIPEIEPYTTTDLTTLISTSLFNTAISPRAIKKRLTQYSLQWIVQLPLLQQSLSNAVHTYLSTLSIPGLTTIETTIDKI
jgi:hypothetical protein